MVASSRQLLSYMQKELSVYIKKVFGDVDYHQAMLRSIINSIGRAAGGLRQVANADTAIIHKMPIAFLHTAPKIVLRGVSHLICAALDLFVSVDIRLRPAASLIKAWYTRTHFPCMW